VTLTPALVNTLANLKASLKTKKNVFTSKKENKIKKHKNNFFIFLSWQQQFGHSIGINEIL